MEPQIQEILSSLEQRSSEFRDQVVAIRQFREKMKDAGASITPDEFTIPSMSRLETPQNLSFFVD